MLQEGGERLVESGRVSIDGKPAMLGSQVEEHNRICIDGKEIQRQERKVLLLFHKPRGIECTCRHAGKEKCDFLCELSSACLLCWQAG